MKTKEQIIKAKYTNGIIKATDFYIITSRLKTAFFYEKKSCNQQNNQILNQIS